MPLARKNLFAERTRLLVSVIGVAFAVILILVMIGVFVGTTNQVTTYIDHTESEVWVMQDGVSQMFRSVSVLPQTLQDSLESLDGVETITPILGVPSSFDHNGDHTAFYLLGYDETQPIGGPWAIKEGIGTIGANETILDRVLARKNNVSVGDTVELMDEPFKVVGLSDETAAVGNFYAFIRMDDARRILKSEQRVSYFLITPKPDTDIPMLRQRIIDASPDVPLAVWTREEFAENSRSIVISMIGRPLYVMIVIGFLVGVAIVALTVLSVTTEQMRDYGVIKAIGAKNSDLYQVVIKQALIMGILGYAFGAAIAYGAQFVIRERLGDVNVEISPWLLGSMFVLTLVMAVFASVLPVRRIANVDPAVVFRA